jgi:predicted HTH transcriptional regulator
MPVAEILDSGDFSGLIGMSEDVELEVKSAPYDLTSPHGRYELAKDVSAFANAQGGFLLIGFTTCRVANTPSDAIEALALVPCDSFVARQYQGIINELIFPAIEGCSAEWRQCIGSVDGIGIIRVPPQDPDRKPFIIARVFEDGESLKQIVVGYVERQGSSNEPLTATRIQRDLKKGRDTVSQRLTRMEEKIDQILSPAVARASATPPTPETLAPILDEALLKSRVEAIVEDVEE